jgi:hypothetical protein
MIDEIFDRAYREGRAELNASLTGAFHGFAAGVRDAFVVLNRIEYRAPWIDRAIQRRRS